MKGKGTTPTNPKSQPTPDFGNLSEDEFKKLKNQHGKIYHIWYEDEDEETTHHFWFKKPTRLIISAVAKVEEDDPIEAVCILFKNCLIHGDKDAIEDVDVIGSIGPVLQKLIKRRQAHIKNY